MKLKRIVLIALSLALLASCKMDLRGVIYVNDILETVAATEQMYSPATIAIEAPGDDQEEAVAGLFKKYFEGADNIRKQEVDGNDSMLADIMIPLVAGKGAASGESLFDIAVVAGENGKLDLYLRLNREAYKALGKEVEDIAYQKLNLSDMSFTFALNNDSRSVARFETSSVYANRKPYPYRTTLDRDRRKTVEIKVSDVLRDQLAQTDSILIASLLK